jgi:hypothetical protein
MLLKYKNIFFDIKLDNEDRSLISATINCDREGLKLLVVGTNFQTRLGCLVDRI